jgi:multiple sugar transport system substrate-binding protein
VKRLVGHLFGMASLVLTACVPSAPCAPAPTACTSSAPCAPASTSPTPSSTTIRDEQLIFLSTQFTPPREIDPFRRILRSAPVEVNFSSLDTEAFSNRVDALQHAGKVRISLVGGPHADLAPFQRTGYLEELTALMSSLSNREFPEPYRELSRLDTDQYYYVPWTRATYVLVVNKKAMPYLPAGASLDALTYDQLREWGERILRETGQRKLGFPAGERGLLYRFFQGYLYPSFTGSSVVEFRSAAAELMWREFGEVWKVTNPASTTYDWMQEPLENDEVWIAWDHTARLITVLKQRSDDFLVVPAPVGPKGRGYMVVPSGLGIPKQAPNRQGAERLIAYLTEPEQQLATLCELGFFPASGATRPEKLPPGLQRLVKAVAEQEATSDGVLVLPLIGLGARGSELNKVYLDTFSRIALRQEPIPPVLAEQGKLLQDLLNATGAGCWPPDSRSDGPCLVK